MIIPFFYRPIENDKCHNCGKDEDLITICSHCGAEQEDDSSFIPIIIACFVAVFIIWFGVTILAWTMFNRNNNSLLEILMFQLEWIRNLRVY